MSVKKYDECQLLGGKTNPHVCLGFAASLTIILLMHQYGEFPWPFLAMFSDFDVLFS